MGGFPVTLFISLTNDFLIGTQDIELLSTLETGNVQLKLNKGISLPPRYREINLKETSILSLKF